MLDRLTHRVHIVEANGEGYRLRVTLPPKTGPGVMLESGHLDAIERGSEMSKKWHTPQQIINKLRQAEVELANDATAAQACKKIGVTEQTYYRWRSEYRGMRVDQAKRLKELEKVRMQVGIALLVMVAGVWAMVARGKVEQARRLVRLAA